MNIGSMPLRRCMVGPPRGVPLCPPSNGPYPRTAISTQPIRTFTKSSRNCPLGAPKAAGQRPLPDSLRLRLMAEHGWRVLVTGATGRIGFPIARALAARHQVFGLARCRKPSDVDRLIAAGITPIVGDLATIN